MKFVERIERKRVGAQSGELRGSKTHRITDGFRVPKTKSIAGRLPNRSSLETNTRYSAVRNDIFLRAMVLFGKQGFRGTSMQDVADECGVTKPAIYYYFKDKYHLLQLLYESITKEFYEQIESLLSSSAEPKEKLCRLIEMQVLYSVKNCEFQRLFQRERHELKEPARSSIAQ